MRHSDVRHSDVGPQTADRRLTYIYYFNTATTPVLTPCCTRLARMGPSPAPFHSRDWSQLRGGNRRVCSPFSAGAAEAVLAFEIKNGCVYDSWTHSTHTERNANGAIPFPCSLVKRLRVCMLLVQQCFIEQAQPPEAHNELCESSIYFCTCELSCAKALSESERQCSSN
jgi:hypothetical protein